AAQVAVQHARLALQIGDVSEAARLLDVADAAVERVEQLLAAAAVAGVPAVRPAFPTFPLPDRWEVKTLRAEVDLASDRPDHARPLAADLLDRRRGVARSGPTPEAVQLLIDARRLAGRVAFAGR